MNHSPLNTTAAPVRRLDRMLSAEEALFIAQNTTHAVLGTVDEAGFPYCVPITPAVVDGKVFFHCAKGVGRKRDNMLANPHVSLCFIGKDDVAKNEFSVNYASAVIQGEACLVSDPAEQRAALLAICRAKDPEAGDEASIKFIEAGLAMIDVWQIKVSSLTGKARNKQLYFAGRQPAWPQEKAPAQR